MTPGEFLRKLHKKDYPVFPNYKYDLSMKKKNILFIHHSPSKNTKKLSKLVENKIGTLTPNINLKTLNLIDTKSSSFKEIDGLIIGTIENFGYMSGLTKDFFDRCYDDLKDKTEGLPIIYYVRAGLDGDGCKD